MGINYVVCMNGQPQPSRLQDSSMISLVFLVSLFSVFVFLGLVIFKFTPSSGCGPFRGMLAATCLAHFGASI